MKKLLYLMLSALFFVSFSLPSYASTFDLPLPEKPSPNSIVYAFKNGLNTTADIIVDGSYYLDFAEYNPSTGDVTYKFTKNITMHRYLYNNNSWSLYNSYTLDTVVFKANKPGENELLYSDVNVYNTDGTIFFQVAPPTEGTPTVEGTITEEMKKFQTTLVGTMRILMVCGVGLIALLIGLNLFGKVFRIFRVK